MGNEVTIKMDSRVMYGLVAVLAVLGIFGIGWWLGNQLGGDSASVATSPVNQAAAPAIQSGAQPGTGVDAAAPITLATPAAGADPRPAQPVSVEAQPVEPGQPRLFVADIAETNFVYDFGEIAADQAVERDFVIKNVGEGVLSISDVSASCGCTAAAVGDSELGAGEETTVRVSYDPRHNQEFGKFIQKQVRIKSNDPLVPLAEFTIQADVAAE